ncbi:MAG: S-layer homology domain-containing protein [Candidatus Aminicenantaceae bacterium]
MKKVIFLIIPVILLGACVSYQPPKPTLYIGNLTPSLVAQLSLEERILTEEAWKEIREGNIEKAKKKISKLDESSPFYHVGLGYIFLYSKDVQTAEENFKIALQDIPNTVLVHLGLAQLYQMTGEDERAFSEYQKAINSAPDHPWAKQQYDYLKKLKTQEALKRAKKYLSEGETEKSKKAFLTCLHYSRELTEAHLALAEIYTNEQMYMNALVHLKTAKAKEPNNVQILKKYAETLYHLQKYKKSLETYKKLANLEPDNRQTQDRINDLKNKLGIFEFPNQYKTISSSEATTREEMAALLAIKFRDYIKNDLTSPSIVTDISTSWAREYILKITSTGIIDVYPNHTFQPKKKVSRVEIAQILTRLIDYLENQGFKFIQQIPPEKIEISDVSPDNIYYHTILEILSYDIMSLSPKNKFNPDSPVSGKKAIQLLDIILILIE